MTSLSIVVFDDDDLCAEDLSVIEPLDLFDDEEALGWDISDELDPEFWQVISDELDKEFWQVMAAGGLLDDRTIRTTATETNVQPSSPSEANPIAIAHAGLPECTNQDQTNELATLTTSQVDGVVSDPRVLSQQLEFVQDTAKLRSQRPGLENSRPDHPSKLVLHHPTPMSVPQEESHALKWAQSYLAQAEEETEAPTKVKPSGKKDPRNARAVKIRMANSKMPLEEVLLKAGYTFDFEDGNGRPIDADNISLKQRKNHLCRMVRKEKQRRRTTPRYGIEAKLLPKYPHSTIAKLA